MNTDGQVESESHCVAVQVLLQSLELPSQQRLGLQVETLFVRIDVLGSQASGTRLCRPVPPISAQLRLRTPKTRVAHQLIVQQRGIWGWAGC
jgi:hypothetical protein